MRHDRVYVIKVLIASRKVSNLKSEEETRNALFS